MHAKSWCVNGPLRNDIGYMGNVVSVGTFSKIFGPGVRVGWMEVPERIYSVIDNNW